MDTNISTKEDGLVFKEEIYQIVGCAMQVANALGHGYLEKIYENALVVELDERKVPYAQQQQFKVFYKNRDIGLYIPDLIVHNSIIVEIKTIDKITNHERGQILNYLKVTNLKAGLILNFKKPKLEWERMVL